MTLKQRRRIKRRNGIHVPTRASKRGWKARGFMALALAPTPPRAPEPVAVRTVASKPRVLPGSTPTKPRVAQLPESLMKPVRRPRRKQPHPDEELAAAE